MNRNDWRTCPLFYSDICKIYKIGERFTGYVAEIKHAVHPKLHECVSEEILFLQPLIKIYSPAMGDQLARPFCSFFWMPGLNNNVQLINTRGSVSQKPHILLYLSSKSVLRTFEARAATFVCKKNGVIHAYIHPNFIHPYYFSIGICPFILPLPKSEPDVKPC